MEELASNSSYLLRRGIESTLLPFITVNSTSVVISGKVSNANSEWRFMVPPYILIFCLSISGNCIVIATLTNNRRMRTVTNIYLLNLAVSDFLLGVLCLPFTLIGQIYRRFLFGAAMCKLIPFLQAVSVSVDVWTLVAISLERYFAICRPLKSRKWQTQCHAYKMIATVWTLSFMLNSPIMVVSKLQPMRGNASKCRENWQSLELERAFNLLLDMALLIVPFFAMVFAYSLIVTKLWRGMRHEIQHNISWQNNLKQVANSSEQCCQKSKSKTKEPETIPVLETKSTQSYCMKKIDLEFRHVVRSTHIDKSIEAKRKVIRMLFVIIVEFFVCWTPLHVINTEFSRTALSVKAPTKFRLIPRVFIRIYLFYPEELYQYIGSKGVMSLQLLAYCSSFCNPITYCFMNHKFRQAFLALFKNCQIIPCCLQKDDVRPKIPTVTPPPLSSSQEITACVVRASNTGRSELDGPEDENCV